MLFGIFIRKSCYKIHVDQVKSHITCLAVDADHIFCSMLSADPAQSLRSHSLRIYAYPGNAVISHRFKLAVSYRVRPSRFDCDLAFRIYLKI